MGKSEQLAKYELVVIVDAKLTNDTKESIRKEVADLIAKHGGKVINSQVWLEKHKFTVQIKKCDEGTYTIINFEGESKIVEAMKPAMKLNEKILRFAFIRVKSKSETKAVSETAGV